jgi:hypothetical protein
MFQRVRELQEENLFFRERIQSMDREFSLTGKREKSRVAERVLKVLRDVFRTGKADELFPLSPGITRIIRGLRSGCERLFLDSRTAVHDWIPPVLFEKGLYEALLRLSARIGVRSGTKVGIKDHGCPGISNISLQIVLYQMIRAMVLGAVETGSALLEISLKGDSKYAMVTVCDLTSGAFRKSVREDTNDFVCQELRGRVLRLGGFFHMEQDQEGGRKYMLVLPVA